MNIFGRKKGPTFEGIRPHTAEVLPEGYFHCTAGDKQTLGFKCTNWFAYDVRTPVNDGKQQVHLAEFLIARGMKSEAELPTVVLTMQRADRTQQNISGHHIIETDDLDNFNGQFGYDASGVAWT